MTAAAEMQKAPAESTSCSSSGEGLRPHTITHEGERTMISITHAAGSRQPSEGGDLPEVQTLASRRFAPHVERLFRLADSSSLVVSDDQPAPDIDQTPPAWSTVAQGIACGDHEGPAMPPEANQRSRVWRSPVIEVIDTHSKSPGLQLPDGVCFPGFGVQAAQFAGWQRSVDIGVTYYLPGGEKPGRRDVISADHRVMRRVARAIIALADAIDGGDGGDLW